MVGLYSGLVMGGLGAKGAIFWTSSGLGIDNGAELNPSSSELIANSASAMKEEGKQAVFNLQELLRRGRRNSIIVQGLLHVWFNEL